MEGEMASEERPPPRTTTPDIQPVVTGNSDTCRNIAEGGIPNIAASEVRQVMEADRLSNDSPMFSDSSPAEQEVLTGSSGSEDAFRSLEKLESLARLAETSALEERDVDTPQSFVTAEEGNCEDYGATREKEKLAEQELHVQDHTPDSSSANDREGDLESDTIDVSEKATAAEGIENTRQPQFTEDKNRDNVPDKAHQEDSEHSRIAEEPEKNIEIVEESCENASLDKGKVSPVAEMEQERSTIDGTSCGDDEAPPGQQQQPPVSSVSADTSVVMATSRSDGKLPASPIHQADDDDDDELQIMGESTANESSSVGVGDKQPSENPGEETSVLRSAALESASRPLVIEDEETGAVTVTYRDKEVVRVEVNGSSSEDEFSEIEETEEQKTHQESRPEVTEKETDDVVQPVKVQVDNTTRASVIQAPVVERTTSSTPTSTTVTSHTAASAVSQPAAAKPSVSIQKKKESKLEASIRKISHIREKANLSETSQSDVAQTSTGPDVRPNVSSNGAAKMIVSASSVNESDNSEDEMVIDERTETERLKQQRKEERKKSAQKKKSGGGSKGKGKAPVESIRIEAAGKLPTPPPLISDDVIITSAKQNADCTAFKAVLQIKQEKEDPGYNQYQQFNKQPPPPYMPPYPRAPIGINLSTGRAVGGGGMYRGPHMPPHQQFNRLRTPPAYTNPTPIRLHHNTAPFHNPLHGLSTMAMSHAGGSRTSQGPRINVVMPGVSTATAMPRLGGNAQSNMRIMVPSTFTNTSTSSGKGGSKQHPVTLVLTSKGNPINVSQNKVVQSNSVNVSVSSSGTSNKKSKSVSPSVASVNFIKKLSLELPKYTPAQPPEKLRLNSVEQHTCLGCQDKFTSKSSLDWHRARQSMLLTFTCRRCQKHITFSNKCALLSHISSHGIFYHAVEKALSEGNLTIKPLHTGDRPTSLPAPNSSVASVLIPTATKTAPASNKGDSVDTTTKTASNLGPEVDALIQKSKEIKQTTSASSKTIAVPIVSGQKLPENAITGVIIGTAVTVTNAPQKGEAGKGRKEIKILPKPGVHEIKILPVAPAQLQCAECGKKVPHHAALKDHFLYPADEQQAASACRNKQCSLVLPTQCSRDAHERYAHFQGSKPHVCPECGVECGNNLKVFRKHLSQVCYHLSRIMIYCCPKCGFCTTRAEDIVEHAVDMHGEKYHKCLQCPMAFKSRSTFLTHCKNTHDFEDDGDPDQELPPHKFIYKCPMCDTVFQKFTQLNTHLVQHYPDTKKVQKLGFRCTRPTCDFLTRADKGYVQEHLRLKHNIKDFVTNMCHICGRIFGTDNEKSIHIIQMHPSEIVGTPSPPKKALPSPVTPDTNGIKQEPDMDMPEPEIRPVKKIQVSKPAPVCQKKTPEVSKLPAASPRPGPASSKKRAASPSSSVESASSSSGNNNKRARRRYTSPVKELVTGTRNAGMRTLCNRCGIRFESDVDYIDHMRVHQSRKRSITTSNDNKKFAPTPKRSKVESPEEKAKPKTSPKSKPKPSPEIKAKTSPSPKSKVQVELEEVPARVPCTDCDMVFFTEAERESHMQSEHALVPQFSCHLCGLTYQVKSQLQIHVSTFHEGKSADAAYTCWICLEKNVHKSYQKRTLLESHIKSVHKIPRNAIDFSKIPEHSSLLENSSKVNANGHGAAEEKPVKRLRVDGDEQFSCAKCNFVCKDREEFQTHIAKHKSMEEDALQCNECGMSFMTQPSLKRHLFMVHKIRNLQRYQEESGVSLEQAAAKGLSPLSRSPRSRRGSGTVQNGYTGRDSDGAELDGLECTVCYKDFESEAMLRKHMRMHGMAFIRSRRLDTAST